MWDTTVELYPESKASLKSSSCSIQRLSPLKILGRRVCHTKTFDVMVIGICRLTIDSGTILGIRQVVSEWSYLNSSDKITCTG
ncbi:hypothetical protein H6P81_017082 [Aristolochia fimbriata]|uniref:Uncharacterized protein n=1 Tax=Aristolochia fimbriata TaxID=158543 RepID=A0AAV7E1E3_ARIFI|nr:hypothetical protein H6P81_017082 [Aristolochia fimbriata]